VLGIDVYEQEEIVLQDLSADIIKDDVIQRLMSFLMFFGYCSSGIFTEEALTEILW
jgi:D-lactate dehydrogenase